jgi:hypothetical protein
VFENAVDVTSVSLTIGSLFVGNALDFDRTTARNVSEKARLSRSKSNETANYRRLLSPRSQVLCDTVVRRDLRHFYGGFHAEVVQTT